MTGIERRIQQLEDILAARGSLYCQFIDKDGSEKQVEFMGAYSDYKRFEHAAFGIIPAARIIK